jgi:nitrogen fixation NifU-like protein
VAKDLDVLPSQKMHCSNLGADALHKAIEDYLSRHPQQAGAVQVPEKTRDEVYADRFGGPLAQPQPAAKIGGCSPRTGFACCPFCDAEIPKDSKICEPCGKELTHCPKCNAMIPKGAHDCPVCGFDLEHQS